MKNLNKKYQVKANIHMVFEALTNPKLIEKWSGSPAEMNLEQNGTFSLWGGEIHGINKKISANLIVQDWKEQKWNEFSVVTFEVSGNESNTTIELLHTGIPEGSFEGINKGWDKYYMEPMIALVEAK